MIEFIVDTNGSSHIEPTRTENGIDLIAKSLDEAHASVKEVAINQIRRAVLCDQLGYEYWFMTEHHFQPEGAEFSPNPLMMEMAIAALTTRIRLGQGANIVSWHHPVRLAEQAAILDIVSGGRLEFGAARGYQSRETEVLGGPLGSSNQDQERNRAYFDEALDIIVKCWTEPSFNYQGEFFTIPPSYTKWDNTLTLELFKQPGAGRTVEDVFRFGDEMTLREISVMPQPLQKPYPQIWTPVTSGRSIDNAARRGANAYTIVGPTATIKLQVERYMKTSEDAGWPDRLHPGQPFKYGFDSGRKRGFGVGRFVHVVTKDAGNLHKARRGMEAEWGYYAQFGLAAAVFGPDSGRSPTAKLSADDLIDTGNAIFGEPDYVIEEILKLKEEIGYEDMIMLLHPEVCGLTHTEMEDQLHAFAEHVMPVLRRECGGAPERPECGIDLTPETPAPVRPEVAAV